MFYTGSNEGNYPGTVIDISSRFLHQLSITPKSLSEIFYLSDRAMTRVCYCRSISLETAYQKVRIILNALVEICIRSFRSSATEM